MAELKWTVGLEADSLLAEKFSQLPNGRTQNCETWAEVLAPLIGEQAVKTRAALVQELKDRKQFVREAMATGRIVVWRQEIDEECAKLIANVCCERDREVPNWRKELDAAVNVKNGPRILEIAVGLLVPNLLTRSECAQMMSFVGSWIHLTPTTTQKEWQSKVKPFLLSSNEADVLAGLEYIQKSNALDPGIRSELLGLSTGKNPKVVDKSKALLADCGGTHP